MKKLIILIIVILVAVFVVLFYYISKNNSPTLVPNTQKTETQQPENIPFDANDNLDQAIEDLNQME